MNLLIEWFLRNWDSWGNLYCVLLGAMISLLFNVFVAKQRVRNELKIDTFDKLNASYATLQKDLHSISCSYIISSYNTNLEFKQKMNDIIGKINNAIDEMDNRKEGQEQIESIIKNIQNKWDIYGNSLLEYIRIIEMRQVILYRYIGFHHQLLSEYKGLTKIYDKLYQIVTGDIWTSITSSQHVENEIVERLKAVEKEFSDKNMDIISIAYDLNIELQNDFIGKIFHRKIPRRKPADKGIKVYKAGHICDD
jgi:hypothetical protein